VADFAVAHLALGQADAAARDLEPSVRARFRQSIEDRRLGRGDRISATVTEPPAVEDDQRSFHVCSDSGAA